MREMMRTRCLGRGDWALGLFEWMGVVVVERMGIKMVG
jgi:hypothetical protein